MHLTMSLQRPTTTPDDAPLHALLDANLQLPPEYRDQLTNHLPMALHALHSLGASAQRMQAFYAHYTRRFSNRGVALTGPADGSNANAPWQTLRGQDDAFAPLQARFTAYVEAMGIPATLRLLLPDLLPGVAAAAFHGVIRTAHALESGHIGELASALAYWAWRWQPLAPPAPAPARVERLLDVETWSRQLVAQSVGWQTDGSSISIRMAHASHSDVYQHLAGAPAPAVDVRIRIAELAAVAVQRYVQQPNFTVLHMVTSLRALRTLLPWLPDTEATQAVLANCFVAAYMAAQVAPADAPPVVAPREWPEVIAAAIASDDDHVIKLVHACREEQAAYGQGPYLLAATLAIRVR